MAKTSDIDAAPVSKWNGWAAALALVLVGVSLFVGRSALWAGLTPRWPEPDTAAIAASAIAAVLLLRTTIIRGGDGRLRLSSALLLVLTAFLLGRNLLWLPLAPVWPLVLLAVMAFAAPLATILTFSNLTQREHVRRDSSLTALLSGGIAVGFAAAHGFYPTSTVASVLALAVGVAWVAFVLRVGAGLSSVADSPLAVPTSTGFPRNAAPRVSSDPLDQFRTINTSDQRTEGFMDRIMRAAQERQREMSAKLGESGRQKWPPDRNGRGKDV